MSANLSLILMIISLCVPIHSILIEPLPYHKSQNRRKATAGIIFVEKVCCVYNVSYCANESLMQCLDEKINDIKSYYV